MPADWPTIGDGFVDIYHAYEGTIESKYFHHFEFTEDDPLAAVVPPTNIEKFFGTSVLNILIISKPFGWSGVDGGDVGTYSWPPPGYADSKARLIAAFKYFASYETMVWVDMTSDGSECEDDTPWTDIMNMTSEGIQDMCTELAEYGFTYMGQITAIPDPSFFQSYMDDHFKRTLP